MKQLLTGYASLSDGKAVADPSNPVGFTAGGKPSAPSPKARPRVRW
jgi:hypothetical protein